MRSADTTYKRVWTWRTRYATNLGGLGTGIGEGNEGVQCAREHACSAATCTEVECESAEVREVAGEGEEAFAGTAQGVGMVEELVSDGGVEKAGYWRQEIEGIGGVVKRKVKRRVRVGRAVREYEDERECAGYLEREGRGEERSWCGWCCRVVPGERDLEAGGRGWS